MFHSYSTRYFYLINLVVGSVNERTCLIIIIFFPVTKCKEVFNFFHVIVALV